MVRNGLFQPHVYHLQLRCSGFTQRLSHSLKAQIGERPNGAFWALCDEERNLQCLHWAEWSDQTEGAIRATSHGMHATDFIIFFLTIVLLSESSTFSQWESKSLHVINSSWISFRPKLKVMMKPCSSMRPSARHWNTDCHQLQAGGWASIVSPCSSLTPTTSR